MARLRHSWIITQLMHAVRTAFNHHNIEVAAIIQNSIFLQNNALMGNQAICQLAHRWYAKGCAQELI